MDFRARLSTLKSGKRVQITSGRHEGKVGTVLEWNVEKMKWRVDVDGGRKIHFSTSSLKACPANRQAGSSAEDMLAGSSSRSSKKLTKRTSKHLADKGRSKINNLLGSVKTKTDRRKSLDVSMLSVAIVSKI